MSDTQTLPPAVETETRLPYSPDVKVIFEDMVTRRIEQIKARANDEIHEIEDRAIRQCEELKQALAHVVRDVPDPLLRIGPGPVGRDPYGTAPAWADDKKLDAGVDHLMRINDDGSEDDGEDEGAET